MRRSCDIGPTCKNESTRDVIGSTQYIVSVDLNAYLIISARKEACVEGALNTWPAARVFLT